MNNISKIPAVSVLIPLYNTERYIRDTIESFLNQTFQDFEIIVCDDCSADESYEIVKSIDDSRIRLYRNEKNHGNGYTRNRLISLATGKYCAMFDCDDISYPHRLQTQYDFLESHPEIDACTSSVDIIDENSRKTDIIWYNEYKDSEQIKIDTLYGCAVPQVTLFFHRQKFINKGIRYEEIGADPADDINMYKHAIFELNFSHMKDPLVAYRVWGNQYSKRAPQYQRDRVAVGLEYSYSRLGLKLTQKEKGVLNLPDETTNIPDYIRTRRRLIVKVAKKNKKYNVYNQPLLKEVLLRRHRDFLRENLSKFKYKILSAEIKLIMKFI